MKKFILSVLSLSLTLFIIIGCGTPTKTISFIGTGDLQGIITPYEADIDLNGDGEKEKHTIGGIAKIAYLIKEAKKNNPSTIAISSGDDLMGKFFHTFKGKAIFSLMDESGYEIYAFGNHEFDKGRDTLADALKEINFTPLCTDLNVSLTDLKDECTKYLIKEVGGVKIGFFSLMTEEFPMITLEKKVKLKESNIKSAKKAVKTLKEKGADIIVAVTHIGEENDEKIAKEVKGIDLIFGGHSHEYLKEPKQINNTWIVNGGEKSLYLVKVNLAVKNKKVDLSKSSFSLIPIDENVKEDPNIKEKLEEYEKLLPPAIKLGITKKEWNLEVDEVRKGECTVCDMINDLLKEQFEVDIVLNNSGAFRGKKIYPAGDITDEILREIDEFGNYAYIFSLKGKYLKEILEHSAANYGEGGFLQVSGLRYEIDLRETPQKIEGEKIFQKGERVKKIEIYQNGEWKDVEDEKTYKILSNDFLVNHGGDGYFWFKKYGEDFQNTFTTFYSIMASYLEKYGELTPPEKDERIVIEF